MLHHKNYAFATPTRTTKFLLLKLFRNSKKPGDRRAKRSQGISLASLDGLDGQDGQDGTSEMPRSLA